MYLLAQGRTLYNNIYFYFSLLYEGGAQVQPKITSTQIHSLKCSACILNVCLFEKKPQKTKPKPKPNKKDKISLLLIIHVPERQWFTLNCTKPRKDLSFAEFYTCQCGS